MTFETYWNENALRNVDSQTLSIQTVVRKYEVELHQGLRVRNVVVFGHAGKTPKHIHDANANEVLKAKAGNTPHHFGRENHALTQHTENIQHSISYSNATLNYNWF